MMGPIMNSQTGQHTGTKGCSLSDVIALFYECIRDVSLVGYSSTSSACAIDSCYGHVPLTGDVHVGE